VRKWCRTTRSQPVVTDNRQANRQRWNRPRSQVQLGRRRGVTVSKRLQVAAMPNWVRILCLVALVPCFLGLPSALATEDTMSKVIYPGIFSGSGNVLATIGRTYNRGQESSGKVFTDMQATQNNDEQLTGGTFTQSKSGSTRDVVAAVLGSRIFCRDFITGEAPEGGCVMDFQGRARATSDPNGPFFAESRGRQVGPGQINSQVFRKNLPFITPTALQDVLTPEP